MIIRTGRKGRFLGCSGYPKCKNTAEVPAKLIEELGLNEKADSRAQLCRWIPKKQPNAFRLAVPASRSMLLPL